MTRLFVIHLFAVLLVWQTSACYLITGPGGMAGLHTDGRTLATPRIPPAADCREHLGALVVDGAFATAGIGGSYLMLGLYDPREEVGGELNAMAFAPLTFGMLFAASFFLNLDLGLECRKLEAAQASDRGPADPARTDDAEEIGWLSKPPAGAEGSRHELYCPPGGRLGAVWGNGIYTDDSSVCSAAVLEGRITVDSGGVVEIEIRPGQSAYLAGGANGVQTRSYGPWKRSFVFVGR